MKAEARIARARAQYPVAARRLSEMVLGPVDPRLSAINGSLVAGDGALQYIPFAVLPVRRRARRSGQSAGSRI